MRKKKKGMKKVLLCRLTDNAKDQKVSSEQQIDIFLSNVKNEYRIRRFEKSISSLALLKSLNSVYNPNNTQLPTTGNMYASFAVMVSA